jgi:hypothetical protein
MIISYQQLSLSGSSRLTFGSAPQSAPDPGVRPLANAVAAIRALGSPYRSRIPVRISN